MTNKVSSIFPAVPTQKPAPEKCRAPFEACKYRRYVLELLVVGGLAGAPFAQEVGEKILGAVHKETAGQEALSLTISILMGGAGLVIVRSRRRERRQIAELTEQKERLEAVMAATGPVMMYPVDDLCALQANRSFLEALGYDAREVRRLGPVGIVAPESQEDVRQRIKNDVQGGHFVAYLLRKDGGKVPMAANTHIAQIGGRRFRVVSFTDVSALRQREEELRRIEAELRQQVALARDAGKAKGDFLARMSHEIRTPLTPVIALPELMIADVDAAKNASDPALRAEALGRLRKNMELVRSSGEGLLRLIDDVLDMSTIDAGKMSLANDPFRADDKVRSAMAPFEGLAAGRGGKVKFSCEFPDGPFPYVIGDPVRFQQVIANLVGNAAKFTEAGSVRAVAKWRRDERGVGVEIAVHDTGCGIPESSIGKLFSPFEQAPSNLKNSLKGTGLGLAISRNLAMMMGGDVTVASELGKGSTFAFRCRLAEAETPAPQAAEEAPPALPRLKILMAEDNDLCRMVAEQMLVVLGQDVTTVQDGCDVIPALEKDAYDLVFLDGQMTTVNGDEAARAVLAHPDERVRKTPLVALTASGTEEFQLYLDAGMRDIVTKPIVSQQLAAVIVKYGKAAGKALPPKDGTR